MKTASFAKETIERKFKNKKIEYDEPVMMRLITRLGYKHVTEFYKAIAEEVIDVNTFIDRYIEALKKEHETPTNTPIAGAFDIDFTNGEVTPSATAKTVVNYSFGEGGAGAYSDGKLYTRSKKRGSVDRILNILCQFDYDLQHGDGRCINKSSCNHQVISQCCL